MRTSGAPVRSVQAFLAGVLLMTPAVMRLAAQAGSQAASRRAPTKSYTVLVASESVGRVSVVEFGPQGAKVVRTQEVGVMLADPDGPHGLGVSPDGAHYYVTTAHGTPYGVLWKFDAASHAYAGQVMLGNFPATLQVSPDGSKVVAVNFNLHGDMVPSDVSIVRTDSLQESARIPTCTMPHGSRINRAGTRHYSACMMDDLLVEIDLDGAPPGSERLFLDRPALRRDARIVDEHMQPAETVLRELHRGFPLRLAHHVLLHEDRLAARI